MEESSVFESGIPCRHFLPGSTLMSGRAVTIRARLGNVIDEEYLASVGGFPGANYLIPGNPRTFSLTATLDLQGS